MFKPYYRPRRLRQNPAIRRMFSETKVSVDDLIMPIFVVEGDGVKNPISSMPGIFQFSIDNMIKEAQEIYNLGIPAVILFGIPEKKDAVGSDALSENGIMARAIKAVKKAVPELYVISDLCFCEYTDHGHCGIIKGDTVDNDSTLDILGEQAIVHAKAGVDMVAPSGMMDGMVGAIREALDDENYEDLPIMSYSVKYSSAFYGPFRDAADSTPQFGDRKSYQMDPANVNEAMREASLDVEEGADVLMVKPALSYLDVVSALKQNFSLPVVTYNVSGEYSMVKAAAINCWIDEKKIVLEMMISMKRAGADTIITYSAKDIAGWLAK